MARFKNRILAIKEFGSFGSVVAFEKFKDKKKQNSFLKHSSISELDEKCFYRSNPFRGLLSDTDKQKPPTQ